MKNFSVEQLAARLLNTERLQSHDNKFLIEAGKIRREILKAVDEIDSLVARTKDLMELRGNEMDAVTRELLTRGTPSFCGSVRDKKIIWNR